LRRHDHDIRASVLVAEWPPRTDVPDPDPMAVVHFTSADPVLAQCEHGRKPVVIRPEQASRALQRWIGGSKPATSPSIAAAPLVSGEMTTGVLGFVKNGDRKWKQEEINTLEAVAALLAQLQARIAAEEKLRYLAEHDDLTGLYNRRALVAHLTERLAAASPGPVAVLYLDLDRLKPINDYLGHAAGDWFIRVFAQRMRVCAGSGSMIARLGGDEFVVIPDQPMSTGTAESFARRLGAMLHERLAIGGHMITRTVSIGLAVGTPGRDNCTDVLRRADEAVLTAKRGGGNQVALSTDAMSLKSAFRNDIEMHLRGDIDSEALLLHYLPEVDLWTGAIVAAEALVRWRHPIWGLLLPDSFIGVAESTNLAGELGRWVMRSACAEFSRWRSNGVGKTALLRINVSPIQLITRGFVRSVADTIGEFGIDAGSVCLEITERAVLHDIETTRKTLAELKEVGVQIAIDDFGTGYAVLSHLKSLPVDMLKIDTGFVRDLGTNAGDLAIVRAIIGLAEAFGLQVVAEGVETPAAALTLMQHGCHRAQGFLLSRPVPGNAMEALLAARWLPMPFLADREALSAGAI
jgi:diguanylate cyclase (GGDEF)-like protein